MIKNALLAAMALICVSLTALAQDVQKIVAVVNDEIISGYDLTQRIKLTIVLSGFPDTEETRRQLINPTVSRLIDDRLKLQEAQRYNVTVSDEEVLEAVKYLEQQNGMRPGEINTLLERNGIDIETMLAQVRANITWNLLIEQRILPRITVSDDEVAAVQERLEANKGKTEYLLSEIFLPIDTGTNEQQLREGVANLVSQIRAGASFQRAAAQVSQGATAASGGSIGWVLDEEVEPEIAAVLDNLQPGQVSDPIRTPSGYYIVMIQQERAILDDNPDDIALDLTQIVVPPPAADSSANADDQKKLATTISNVVDGCRNLPTLLTELNSRDSGQIGRVRLGDMPDHIKTILKDMKVNDVSAPYQDGDVYRIFVVCGRNDPQARTNDPDEIRREIMLRRAENRSRGYLQDIHNAATIETR